MSRTISWRVSGLSAFVYSNALATLSICTVASRTRCAAFRPAPAMQATTRPATTKNPMISRMVNLVRGCAPGGGLGTIRTYTYGRRPRVRRLTLRGAGLGSREERQKLVDEDLALLRIPAQAGRKIGDGSDRRAIET